jgi:hypothetical protein
MAAVDEELIEGGRGVLPPQICGGNRSSIISNMFFIKNTKGITLGCSQVHLSFIALPKNL